LTPTCAIFPDGRETREDAILFSGACSNPTESLQDHSFSILECILQCMEPSYSTSYQARVRSDFQRYKDLCHIVLSSPDRPQLPPLRGSFFNEELNLRLDFGPRYTVRFAQKTSFAYRWTSPDTIEIVPPSLIVGLEWMFSWQNREYSVIRKRNKIIGLKRMYAGGSVWEFILQGTIERVGQRMKRTFPLRLILPPSN